MTKRLANRIYNFSAGPATLPDEVLLQVQEELLNYHGAGVSLMEISHRREEFIAVTQQAEQDLRELLHIPDNYYVLFLQGGARGQFAGIPLNLLGNKKSVDYINTGVWSQFAIDQAKHYCEVNVVANSEDNHFTTIPAFKTWQINPQAAYFHYVDNETVNGIEFPYIPDVGDVPLVSDMSSNILSRPFDVTRFGLFYAGAQKNMGPAGITLVVVREDLVGKALPITPIVFDYKVQVEKESMYNTPPTFTWYIVGLVLQWLKRQGGVEQIAILNQKKAKKLYNYIDQSEFYSNRIDASCRSTMNIIFQLPRGALNRQFASEAEQAGLYSLQGHKLIGGIRASIYNAMPEAGIDALLNFMDDFAKQNS